MEIPLWKPIGVFQIGLIIRISFLNTEFLDFDSRSTKSQMHTEEPRKLTNKNTKVILVTK